MSIPVEVNPENRARKKERDKLCYLHRRHFYGLYSYRRLLSTNMRARNRLVMDKKTN